MSVKRVQKMRLFTQLSFLILIALTPLLDLFRLDMAESQFVMMGNHFFINQLYLALIAFILSILMLGLVARNGGRLFCGWLCFQTLWSEMGDAIVGSWRKWKKTKDPKKKTKLLMQILFRVSLAFPLMFAFYSVLVSYFVSPLVMLSWITIGPPTWFLVLFAKFATFGLIDLLIIRHHFCQSICPYGILQQKVQKNESLRVAFDPSHCIDCHLCDQACLMELKPRQLTKTDPCISCAECVVACGMKAEKLAVKGNVKGSVNSLSLRFRTIEPSSKKTSFLDRRTIQLGGVFLLFFSLLFAGILLDDGVDLSITGESQSARQGEPHYALQVTNRRSTSLTLDFQLETVKVGPSAAAADEQKFSINPRKMKLPPFSSGIENVSITPDQSLASGRYTILIRLLDQHGKEVDATKTVYYVY